MNLKRKERICKARYVGYKRPKNTKQALRQLFSYMGLHKWMLLFVAVLVVISTGANVLGTYLLKPVINQCILPGDKKGLAIAIAGMGMMISLRGSGNALLQSFDGEDIPEDRGRYPPGFI